MELVGFNSASAELFNSIRSGTVSFLVGDSGRSTEPSVKANSENLNLHLEANGTSLTFFLGLLSGDSVVCCEDLGFFTITLFADPMFVSDLR